MKFKELFRNYKIIPLLTRRESVQAIELLDEEIAKAREQNMRKAQAEQDRKNRSEYEAWKTYESFMSSSNYRVIHRLVEFARSTPEFQTYLFAWAKNFDPSVRSLSDVEIAIWENWQTQVRQNVTLNLRNNPYARKS